MTWEVKCRRGSSKRGLVSLKQPHISLSPAHMREYWSHYAKKDTQSSQTYYELCWTNDGEYLNLTVGNRPPLLKVYRGSLAGASLKWHVSWARKEINSSHLHRRAEMGSTLNHSSRQDNISLQHFKIWKNFCHSQSSRIMTVSSIFSCATLREASNFCPRGQAQTDRHRGDRQRGRPWEEPVAMLMQCRLSGATVTSPTTPHPPLSALRAQPADFSHFHGQPSFSTLVETGHCHLLLSFWAAEPFSLWEIECSAFCYEQDYGALGWAGNAHWRWAISK